MLLSGLSMMLGRNHWMLDESSRTMSGVVDEPAKLVQPVARSQRRDLTILRVLFSHAHARRVSLLWARKAVGYLPSPDESRVVGVPKLNPVMLF